MALFLGIDGGQSSTVALIADDTGRVLGVGRGGPCNHVAATEGRDRFAGAIHECVGGACAQAGLDVNAVAFDAACLGFSGGTADKDAYSREFIRSREFKITHDAEIALTGATGGDEGIIVIAGTGSIAFGKNEAGKTARAGGWGYVFGDEGGAFYIARQALRAALAMEEGWGAETALRQTLLEQSGAASANSLMHGLYQQFDRKQVARWAWLVDEAAKGADPVAKGILQQAAQELAALVSHVFGILFPSGKQVSVSYVGGVFHSALLTSALKTEVRQANGCEAAPPAFPPAAGALMEALRMTGRRIQLSEIPPIKS